MKVKPLLNDFGKIEFLIDFFKLIMKNLVLMCNVLMDSAVGQNGVAHGIFYVPFTR